MADDWLGISSAELDSFCGEDAAYTLADGLDGVDQWRHAVNEIHWFILDLGQTYTIKQVRGRSVTFDDPIDVNIYIDDSNPPTTLCHEGITTWQDRTTWSEITLDTEGTGRYIKIEIEDTEDASRTIAWGKIPPGPFMTIFDAYGDVAAGGPETHIPSDTAKASDGLAFKAEIPLSDTAKATDSPAFKPKISLSDTAKASDELTTKAGSVLSDIAKASDSIVFKVFHGVTDTARAQDVFFPDKLTLTDVAKAHDSVTYSFSIIPTDDVQIFRNDLSL